MPKSTSVRNPSKRVAELSARIEKLKAELRDVLGSPDQKPAKRLAGKRVQSSKVSKRARKGK